MKRQAARKLHGLPSLGSLRLQYELAHMAAAVERASPWRRSPASRRSSPFGRPCAGRCGVMSARTWAGVVSNSKMPRWTRSRSGG